MKTIKQTGICKHNFFLTDTDNSGPSTLCNLFHETWLKRLLLKVSWNKSQEIILVYTMQLSDLDHNFLADFTVKSTHDTKGNSFQMCFL